MEWIGHITRNNEWITTIIDGKGGNKLHIIKSSSNGRRSVKIHRSNLSNLRIEKK